MQRIKLGLVAALIAVVIILTFQNAEPVEVRLLFFSLSVSGGVLMFVTFLLGAFTGMVVASRMLRAKTDEAG